MTALITGKSRPFSLFPTDGHVICVECELTVIVISLSWPPRSCTNVYPQCKIDFVELYMAE